MEHQLSTTKNRTEILFLESEIHMPVMELPLRCTLLKTMDGVVIISPIRFSEAQIQEINDFGKVVAIVAPSAFHHIYASEAMKKFPQATLWGAPVLQKKRADIPWQKILTRDPWPYQKEIEVLEIKGLPRMGEVVFFCKDLRTLVVTDLCFNIQKPQGVGAFLILKMLGTYKKFAISGFVRRMTEDKKLFKASLETMLQWDFDQLVMAHGEIIHANGKNILRQALQDKNHL